MPISALIIDDEQLAREELKYLLDQVGGVDVVAQGANGIEAIELIEEHHPDLVFLDVQMPGLDGFGVLKQLAERSTAKAAGNAGEELELLPQIVFATAYDQYAVRAFEVNAVDYLLKPFDRARLVQALDRVRARLLGLLGVVVEGSLRPGHAALMLALVNELLELLELLGFVGEVAALLPVAFGIDVV